MAPYVPHLTDQLTHSARAVVTALPYLFFFSVPYGQVTRVHGGFLRRFWGTYLTAQNTRGLLHISSLPVKATSCHGIRVKSSPTFFFRSLAMNAISFMNYESPRATTFFENHTIFFSFFRIRLGLGSSFTYACAPDNSDRRYLALSPPATVSSGAGGVVSRSWLRFRPLFPRRGRGRSQELAYLFLSSPPGEVECVNPPSHLFCLISSLPQMAI